MMITYIYYRINFHETAAQSTRSGNSVSSTSSSTPGILIWPHRTYINHTRKSRDACKKIWLTSKRLSKNGWHKSILLYLLSQMLRESATKPAGS